MKRNSLFVAILVLLSGQLLAAIPAKINYQGRLTNAGGTAVPDGNYSIVFTIYDAPSGGTALWTETSSVSTSGGLFAVLLGSLNPVPDSMFNDVDRYLGVKVGTDPELAPRQRLVSVGYAYRVSSVDGASGGTITGKVSIGSEHTNTGDYTFVAGFHNTVSTDYSSVCGGGSNTASGGEATIGGGDFNTASGFKASIGGGGYNTASGGDATVGGGAGNAAIGERSVVAGGAGNSAQGNYSAVCGGSQNIASGTTSTVGGGQENAASGVGATIPGGYANSALGYFSFAAGYAAQAIHSGSFVWRDYSSGDVLASTVPNEFSVLASGGTRFFSNSAQTAGVTLAPGASAWATVSDSSSKRNIRTVDGKGMLEKVMRLPIKRWSYKAQEARIEHIGPMAQDFYFFVPGGRQREDHFHY